MSIIAMINLKGGVAKTTSAVAIAECLASKGHRTLLIDADHQCMAGELLLGESRQLKCERNYHTLHHLLAEMLKPDFLPARFDSAVARRASNIGGGLEKLSVLPCSIKIDAFSENIDKARRSYRSKEEFDRVLRKRRTQFLKWARENFDFTIVDCPPSMPFHVRFLLRIADGFIVPSIPDRLSIRGTLHLLDRIKRYDMRCRDLGTLWTLYREQIAMHSRFVSLAAKGSDPYHRLPRPFKTIIPNATKIAEASDVAGDLSIGDVQGDAIVPPSTFRKKYTAQFAKLFEELCEEIVQRAVWQQSVEPARVDELAEV